MVYILSKSWNRYFKNLLEHFCSYNTFATKERGVLSIYFLKCLSQVSSSFFIRGFLFSYYAEYVLDYQKCLFDLSVHLYIFKLTETNIYVPLKKTFAWTWKKSCFLHSRKMNYFYILYKFSDFRIQLEGVFCLRPIQVHWKNQNFQKEKKNLPKGRPRIFSASE